MSSPLDSTYGAWLISLVLEIFLYGMGVLQCWNYFAAKPTDIVPVKVTLQLLAAYLSAFVVQMYDRQLELHRVVELISSPQLFCESHSSITNSMMNFLIQDAISRGALTALSSGVNMVLFLLLPDTFWFFLGLAPSSKLYMNSMLASLNRRQYLRKNSAYNNNTWHSISMGTFPFPSNPATKGLSAQPSFASGESETASSVSSEALSVSVASESVASSQY
ncbi:hypothetical protein R3P38DRAFT_2816051 [Favolaschia claudopus]|uniref:DUF6534 domain-containing protein n=1 Tax=Favolaschia claudopus TaxID=2862362 RepID=A0AAV9YZY0_9AGAR